jgi:hypothetical protein
MPTQRPPCAPSAPQGPTGQALSGRGRVSARARPRRRDRAPRAAAVFANDLYRFSPSASKWAELSPIGPAPAPRQYMGFAATPDGMLYVFGGLRCSAYGCGNEGTGAEGAGDRREVARNDSTSDRPGRPTCRLGLVGRGLGVGRVDRRQGHRCTEWSRGGRTGGTPGTRRGRRRFDGRGGGPTRCCGAECEAGPERGCEGARLTERLATIGEARLFPTRRRYLRTVPFHPPVPPPLSPPPPQDSGNVCACMTLRATCCSRIHNLVHLSQFRFLTCFVSSLKPLEA